MERQKLDLEANTPTKITLLFDKPIEGESRYGKYSLFAVRNGDGKEYSFFAPNDDVLEELKKYRQGDELILTKLASKRNNRVVTTYDIKPVEKKEEQKVDSSDSQSAFYKMMEKSFEEAIKLQNKFNGMANVNQIAITLFIQRTKGSPSFAN